MENNMVIPATLPSDLLAQRLAREELGPDCDVQVFLHRAQEIKDELLNESESEQARRSR